MPELTEAAMADHRITFHIPGMAEKVIRAVYVTEDDKLPGMLSFKDHEHKTVALVSKDTVLTVERAGRHDSPRTGFAPTSQIMEQM